jgi:molecular chaperone DnaK
MKNNSECEIVGIDLGTTNSVVAALVDGEVVVLKDDDGQGILPSVVGLDANGNLITGVVAQNQLAAFPDRTIASVKRKMGSGDKVKLGAQSFTPQEISAMILRRLVDRAARELGKTIERAVITVPAFFDENQRLATREAGELAGLQVERIINEPTAATLVYHAGTEEKKHLVVYDFGGGTFDVSVVRLEMGVVEVLSSKGNTHLGGDDIDELLLNHIADEFAEAHDTDLLNNLSTRYRLLQSCEAAKRDLSESVTTTIAEEFIAEIQGNPVNLNSTVSRKQFETMIKPIIDQTIDSVNAALIDAGLTLDHIDDLILVGGSTRIPLVAERLHSEFNLQPSRSVDPDLAVALGAATQAAMIEGHDIGPVLVDITTHTLGIEVLTSYDDFTPTLAFSRMIHRNTPLPARYEEVYSRLHEEQKRVDIRIQQGESDDIEQNRSVGNVILDLETGEENSDDIIVRFDLTLDGTLTVTARQDATGHSEELIINNALSDFDNGENKNKATKRLNAMFQKSNELLETSVLQNLAQQRAQQAALPDLSDKRQFQSALALLEKTKNIKSAAPEDEEDLQSVSEQLKEAIASNDAASVTALSEELEDILFYMES